MVLWMRGMKQLVKESFSSGTDSSGVWRVIRKCNAIMLLTEAEGIAACRFCDAGHDTASVNRVHGTSKHDCVVFCPQLGRVSEAEEEGQAKKIKSGFTAAALLAGG